MLPQSFHGRVSRIYLNVAERLLWLQLAGDPSIAEDPSNIQELRVDAKAPFRQSILLTKPGDLVSLTTYRGHLEKWTNLSMGKQAAPAATKQPTAPVLPAPAPGTESLVSITLGMDVASHNAELQAWGERRKLSGTAVYNYIGALAALSDQLISEVHACPDFQDVSLPGSYAFEVDEPFGFEVMRRILADEDTSDAALMLVLGSSALAFFEQSGEVPHAAAIVERLTGFKA